MCRSVIVVSPFWSTAYSISLNYLSYSAVILFLMKLSKANLVMPVRIEMTISVLAELCKNIESEVIEVSCASLSVLSSTFATARLKSSIFFLFSSFYCSFFCLISSCESSLSSELLYSNTIDESSFMLLFGVSSLAKVQFEVEKLAKSLAIYSIGAQ